LSAAAPTVPVYLRPFAIAVGVCTATLFIINAIGYHFGLVQAADHSLYGEERAKVVDPRRAIDIAFVGDSSCDNAIDVAEFGSLSGYSTVNLALNGAYGSGGAYNMVRKILDHHAPRLIVVMLSIDAMRRNDAFPGYYFSAERAQLKTASFVRVAKLYLNPKTAKVVLEQLFSNGLANSRTHLAGADIGQSEHPLRRPPMLDVQRNPLLSGMVAPEQIHYIRRIAKLCESHGVTCAYAHGPIYGGYCSQAVDYLTELNAGIRDAGLSVVPGTPICMDEADVGNTIDHVRRDLQKAYTRRYFELLRPDIAHPELTQVAPPESSLGGWRGSLKTTLQTPGVTAASEPTTAATGPTTF
jgi:hypothetical protein